MISPDLWLKKFYIARQIRWLDRNTDATKELISYAYSISSTQYSQIISGQKYSEEHYIEFLVQNYKDK